MHYRLQLRQLIHSCAVYVPVSIIMQVQLQLRWTCSSIITATKDEERFLKPLYIHFPEHSVNPKLTRLTSAFWYSTIVSNRHRNEISSSSYLQEGTARHQLMQFHSISMQLAGTVKLITRSKSYNTYKPFNLTLIFDSPEDANKSTFQSTNERVYDAPSNPIQVFEQLTKNLFLGIRGVTV